MIRILDAIGTSAARRARIASARVSGSSEAAAMVLAAASPCNGFRSPDQDAGSDQFIGWINLERHFEIVLGAGLVPHDGMLWRAAKSRERRASDGGSVLSANMNAEFESPVPQSVGREQRQGFIVSAGVEEKRLRATRLTAADGNRFSHASRHGVSGHLIGKRRGH